MFVSNTSELESVIMQAPGAAGASLQVLVGPAEGWQGHVMRLVTLKNKGCSPHHTHPWPHINYVVKGEGFITMHGVDYPVKPGSVAYVPADTEHQYKSNTEDDFQFICIVPEDGHKV